MPGVYTTAVGYAGGFTPNPSYEEVCTARTGHTESTLVVFDPQVIDLEGVLKVFWETHDPTQEMQQGNDVGTQYRSAIYTVGDDAQLARDSAQRFGAVVAEAGLGAIATEIASLEQAGDGRFYYAEDYHQQYLAKNLNGYRCHASTVGCSIPRERPAQPAAVEPTATCCRRVSICSNASTTTPSRSSTGWSACRSQDPKAAFFGLHARLENFAPDELTA